MYTEEEINLIILSSFALTYKAKRRLLSDLSSAQPDFENHENFLIKTQSAGVYNKVKEKFYDPVYRGEVLGRLDKKGVKCVTYFSDGYPEELKDINDAPVLLYCKGDTRLLKSECFSVVGSRKTQPKELRLCEQIAGELSERFTIVSGIAEGADAKALEGALEKGGKVITVLANGLDFVYPACNANLLKRIEREGLIVTEHDPGDRPMPYNFPARNRIIAGLSEGTLVVSASKKSGAMITADYAFGYGRKVFAFPYGVGITSGEGCNLLVKKGAALTENVLDIFGGFGLDFKRREKIPLSEDERAVYELIKNSAAAFLPEIADKLNKSVADITAVVMTLAIKGLVVSAGGNRYSATA